MTPPGAAGRTAPIEMDPRPGDFPGRGAQPTRREGDGGKPMNMPEFPEDTWVEVRYPPTAGQEHGDREAWPWLPGWVVSVCGPDEWQVCVQAPGLGRTAEGEIPAPDVPDEEQYFPLVFRDSSELRAPATEPEAGS